MSFHLICQISVYFLSLRKLLWLCSLLITCHIVLLLCFEFSVSLMSQCASSSQNWAKPGTWLYILWAETTHWILWTSYVQRDFFWFQNSLLLNLFFTRWHIYILSINYIWITSLIKFAQIFRWLFYSCNY